MPYSLTQLNNKLEKCVENISLLKKELRRITTADPRFKHIDLNLLDFFQRLSEFPDEQIIDFQNKNFIKVMQISTKAAKEEEKRRDYQDKIDEISEKVAAKFKDKQKKQKSKSKKMKKKMKQKYEDSSEETEDSQPQQQPSPASVLEEARQQLHNEKQQQLSH